MIPLLSALATLFTAGIAEWPHVRRIRVVGGLAFGPAGALLRRLRIIPVAKFHEPQRAELQEGLHRVQKACFDTGTGGMPEADLRSVAEKWLRLAR